jgi:hypothetical protein
MKADIFDATFAALYVGHVIGDYWVQSPGQADVKGEKGSTRSACSVGLACRGCLAGSTRRAPRGAGAGVSRWHVPR